MVQAIIRKIDAFTEVIGKATMGLALLLVLLVMADVAMRYVFSISFAAVRELEWHMYSMLFLFGGAYTLRHDSHVRVDVAYQHFSPRNRALINVLGCLIFLFPGCFLVIKTSVMFTKFSWMMAEQSPDPGGLPFRWFLKGCLPVAFGLLALQGVSFFLKNLLVLLGKAEPEEA
ncbi:TRAP transporter small permease subunit [Desulfovibrio mangrovi]|uniref:TRAP transporter small permease subunit n=1 Tax=Desulfovibrio mangrovi TaxID=2976983 RepID=UPI00224544B2|nr:TRAP transporter small permease subunit [Desulfovibrio mangrovi]UZP66816.1 TRAP transporter small permease subunit [Desulfovibrio mangrovi]